MKLLPTIKIFDTANSLKPTISQEFVDIHLTLSILRLRSSIYSMSLENYTQEHKIFNIDSLWEDDRLLRFFSNLQTGEKPFMPLGGLCQLYIWRIQKHIFLLVRGIGSRVSPLLQ